MLASLFLPRIATALVVLMGVAAVASVNLLTTAGVELSGLLGALDRFGPPLAAGLVFSISPWIDSTGAAGSGAGLWARLVLWAAIGVAALLFAFRRAELGR